MNELVPNPDFIEWIKTPVGCEGGNIKGAVWFFGIEWGGDGHQQATPELAINHCHDYVRDDYRQIFPDAFQYNTKLTKLYAAMLGQPTEHYARVFQATRMFDLDSDTYKGNIFTLSSPAEDDQYFTPNLQALTGCRTKADYKRLHHEHRFPVLKGWVKEHAPRMIVCFGNSYVNDYWAAFGDGPHKMTVSRVSDVSVSHQLINDGKTLLVVVPFIAYYRSCLNSDDRIRRVGRKLAELGQQYLGEHWCRHTDLKLPPIKYTEPQTLSDKLALELEKSDMDLSQLAEKAELLLSELHAILQGSERLTKETAARLAGVTQTTAREWLMTQLEWECWWVSQQESVS